MSISKRAKKIAAVSLSVLLAVMIVVPLISNIALAADMTVSLSDPTASGINESTRTVLYNTDSTGSAYNLYLDGNEFKIDYTPNDTSVGEWLTQLRAAYYKSFSKKLYGEQRNSYLNYLDYGHDANAEVSSEQALIESANKAYMYSGNYYYITSNVWSTGTLYNPATGEAYEKTSAEKAYKYLDIEQVSGEYKPVISDQPQPWRIIGESNANNNVNYSFIYVDDNGNENMALTLIEDVPSEEIFQEYSFTVTGSGDTSNISQATMSCYNINGTNLGVLKVQSASTNRNDYARMEIADGVLTVTITSDVVTGIILNVNDDNYSTESATRLQKNDVKELNTSYQIQSDGTLLATGETVVTSINQPIEGAETTYELTLTEWTGTPAQNQLFSSDRNVSQSESKGYSMVHLHSYPYSTKYLNASGIKNTTSGQIIEGVTGIENAPRDVTAGNYSNNHAYNWYFTYADSPYTPFPEVKYTWASSNPEIADINDAGYVRIYQPGSVRFTCTASVDTGLTAVAQDEIGPSPLLEKEFYVDYQFTEYVIGTKADPLTDTQDTVNFPGEDEPGSVTIDKSAVVSSTDYYDNGVANVRLEAESLVASEPVDVILVIDASRSMTDFWSEDYDLVFCSGTRTETYINNGKTIIDASYTGSRDITYYVEDGALFDASNNPVSNTYIDVKDMNGNVVAYIYHDSDASTFYLYDTDKTTLISQTDPGERTMRDAEDLILTLNGSSYYAEQGTASDEFIMNYDKMEAARESAATFVNTILNANPSSRIALVQFANDEVKTVSTAAEPEAWQADDANYYQVNSRVICDYTSDRSKLLALISNEADSSENRYAQEGAGSGYYRYGPSVEEIEANGIEAKALASGLVLSNKGGTNYGLAFQYAEEAANNDIGNANANERQIVVFMTDGEPNYLNLGANSFFPNGQDEYLNNMRDATGSKDSPSWSYFALRTQLQDRLDLEKLGYEIISVGFDLDSDGTGYFAPYYKSAVDGNGNLIEGEPVYSLDINEKTYDYDTSLWEDLGVDSTTDAYKLLIEMRKRVVKDIASYEDGYYAVDKYNADGTPDYSALNVAYEDVANSMIFKTTDAVVTDVIGDDYELRLLPFNNNGTAKNPQIVITSADVNITNTYTDSEGNVTHYDTELDTESTQVIETITFTGATLSGGISVVDRYLDEEGNWKETAYTFNSLPCTINGHYVTFDSSSKTFEWTIGDIVNQHFELSYDAYLTGSDPAYEQAMGRTDAEWKLNGSDTAFEKAAAAQTLATNKEATILYKNYNSEYCKQTYNVPKLDWQTTSVTVQKEWEYTNGLHYSNQPEYVTVQLQKSVNGGQWQNVYNPQRVAADSWSYTWYDLPETEDGYAIDYTVVETDVSEAYESTVREDTPNNITITNTLRETQLTVEKVWDDDENRDGVRPDSVTVTLWGYGDMSLEVDRVVLNEDNDWKYTWEHLPEWIAGRGTIYTVTESQIFDDNGVVIYTPNITGSDPEGYVIKNTHVPETVDIPVVKVWQDNNDQDNIRPDSIEIVLSGTDGSVRTVTLPQNGVWSYTFEDLPKYAEGQVGQLITYTASEPVVPEGYTASYSDDKLTIYNTHATDKTSVTATKIWDDNNDQDGLRQDITLQLMNGSTPVDDPVTIRKDDYPNTSSWQVTWSNLEKNQNGNPIVYTVRELGAMEGYETTYSADGLTITNKHTPYTVDYTVTKEWVDEGNRDGARPATITLWLYANDSFYKEQSFSGSGDTWTCTFEDLPQRANGVDIVYTVEEAPIAGYKSVVSGNKITNTHEIDTVDIPVTKFWNDADDQDGKRPESVQLKLSGSDGSEYFVTLPQNGAWSYTFEDLPKYAAGQVKQAITYTVSEPTVPDGYTVSYDQDSYTVINTHSLITTSVTAHKIWDDGNNQDGLRKPVTIQLLATTPTGGTEIVKTVEVSGEGDADLSWTGLPMYKGGEEITYTINEVTSIDGYEKIYTTDKLTVTNKHTPATVNISGTKTWDDNNDQDRMRPDSVTVYVMNGDIRVKSATATAENGWTYTFTDLPKYSNGNQIIYTVLEETVEGYDAPVYNGYDITNKRTPDVVSITVNKFWTNDSGYESERPQSVTVNLMADGVQKDSVQLTAADGWTHTFTDLPEKNNGSTITYTISEVTVDRYDTTYNGYNITNTLRRHDVTVNYEDTQGNTIADFRTPYDNQPEGTQYDVLNVGDGENYKPTFIVYEDNTYVYTQIKAGSDEEADSLDDNKEITYVYTLFNDPAITKTEDKDVLRNGEIITYSLTVTNSNSFDLLDVVVRDPLPAGLVHVDENGNALPDEDGVWTIDRVPARSGDVNGSYTITFCAKVTDRSKAVYTNVGYIDSIVIDADGDDTVDPSDPVKNYNTDPDSEADDNVSNEVEADVVYDLTVEYRAYDTTAQNNYGAKLDTDYTSLNNPNGSSYDVTGEETMPEIIITESGEVWAKKLVSEVDDDPTGIFDDDKKVVVLYEKFDGLYTMYKQVSTDRTNWVDEVTVLPDTQVWFRIVVQNLVPYTITGLDLSDALAFNSAATQLPEGWQDIIDTFPSELTANEIWTSPAMAMTAAGVGGDNYVNTATVTNTDPSISDLTDSAKVNIVSAGALTLTKTADVTAAQDGIKYIAPGAKVPFVIKVTNNGGSELKDVVVVDNTHDVIVKDAQGNETEIAKGAPITTIASLASGESKEITVYIEVSADANNGDQLTNRATATGKDSAGNDVPEATDTDTVVVRCYTVTVNYEDTEENRIYSTLTPYVNQPENTPYDVLNVGDGIDYKPTTIVYEGKTYVYTQIKAGSDEEADSLDGDKEITYVYDLYTDPEIEKDQNKDILRDGDIITYTLTVTNPNSFDLLDVVVRDTLPEGLTFVSPNGQLADEDGSTHTWTISRIPARADGVDGEETITVSAKVTDRSKAIYTNVGYIDSVIIDADGDDTVDPTDPVKNYNTDPDSTADDNVSNEVEADVVYDLTVEYRAYDTTAENNYGTKIDTDYTSLNNPNGSSYDVTGEETMPEIIITESGEVWAKKLVSEADDAPTGIFDDDKKVVVLYEKFDGLYTMYKQVSTDRTNWVDEVTVLPDTQVWFRIVVQNLVPYTITGLDLSDDLAFNSAATQLPEGWQDIIDTFPSELTANEIWTSPAMAMTAAGVGGDNYVNTATVTNTDPSVPDLTDSAKVNIVSAGALTLTKTADVTAAQDGVKYVAPGAKVPFVIKVTNNGGSELKDVVVVDNTHDVIVKDAQGNETEIAKGDTIMTIASLASGESKEITVYIEVSADANNGDQLTNRATATGKDSAGNDVPEATDTDTVVVRCYTVTVNYEDTEENRIYSTLTPYVNQPENTPYDVLNVGDGIDYKPTTIVYEGKTYVYTQIKAGSDEEADSLDGDKEITYVYSLYELPEIVKKVSTNLIHITDESGNTNYDITYTLEVTNPNDFALTDVLVSDEVPAGLTFVSAQEGGSLKDGAVEWTIGTIPAGGTEMVHFTARISDADAQKGIALGDTAPYTNIGIITGMTVDPDGDGEKVADVPLDIPSNPVVTDVYKDPTITKTVDKDRASKGETVTYTVTVTNEGRVPIYKLTVTDTLPEGMEFDSVQIDENNKASAKIQVSAVPGEFAEVYPNEKAQLTISGTTLTAEIPAMAAGATAQITIYAKITDEQYINYVNEAVLEDAYLSYTDDESYIEEMEDTARTDIVSEPYITKTVDKAVALEGDELLYTITVTNPNAEDITDAVVTDAIPAGLTFVSAQGGTHKDGTITWTISSIPSGESRSVTFVARVSDVDNYDEYVNTAYLRSVEMDTDGDDVPDHVEYTDKKDSAQTLPLRDPTITKTQNKDTLRNGEIITYTLTVFNPNSCDLLNVQVRDPLPAGLTYVDEKGNEAADDGGTLSFTVGYIPAGESRTITFNAKVTDRSEAIYANVGYIDSAVADIDDNGTADTTDEQLEYNTDPDSAEDDNISNEVKADVVYDLTVEYRVYDNTAQNNHGEKIEDDYTSLNNPNGSAYDVTGEETVPGIIITETGDIYVRKVVSEAADRPAGTFDGDKTVVVLYEKYDGMYTMYKQVSTDQTNWVDEVTVYPDTTVYFRIVVENLVPYTITGLDLTDALSFNAADGYLPDNWTSVIEAFPSELTANQVWTSPAMTLTAAGVGGDSYVNTATVTNTNQTIPDLTDSAKVNIVTPGQIQLTKTANVAPDENGAKYVKAGSLVSFTITVKNVGGTELKNVVVTDDSHDVIVRDTDGNETRYGKGTPIAAISSLAVNEEKSIDVYIEVSDTMAAGQQLTNQATATGQDPTGSEVTDSDDDTVTVAAALEPVLSIVKKVNNTDARETPLVVAPGQTLTYTVTVTNNSAVDAKGVYVADYMHVGGEKLTEDWAIDKGWTIDVPAGKSVTIQDEVFVMEMPIGQAGTVLNNVALLYTDEKSYTDGKDPIDDDLAMVETDAVYELEVVKVAQTATVEPGDTAGYIITVTNKSNADLANVKVSDSLNGTWGRLPVKTAAEEKVSVVKNEDNTLTIDALKAGDSIRFEYSYDVDEDIEEDTVTNTATAESQTPDGKITDSSEAVVTVFRNSLKLVKTASVDTASPGATVRFIITVTNTGKGELKNVVVTDDLDVTVAAEATSDAEGNVTDSQTPSAALLAELDVDQDDYENKVIGFFETLAAGESKTILVDYVIPEDAEAEEIITNTADAAADGGHEATDNDSVEVVDNRVYEYKLNVVKTANVTVADPGDTVTYTIVVTNTGDAELTNVTISDSLPVLYDGKSIMANQTLITIPSLAPNESKSITVTYPISANQTSKTLTNTAKADSDQTEPVESQVTITVAQPEVKVTKTANSQQVVAGNKVYYTITVTNTGNVKLTNLEVKDAKVGYSYVIPELDVGKNWVSDYGDLYYTFGASAAVGSSFTNNASVGNEKVKGSTANTTTTVIQDPNDYKGPATGDITVSVGQTGNRVNHAWSIAASSAILAAVAAVVIIRRKRAGNV